MKNKLLITLGLLILTSSFAYAKQSIKQEIIERCRNQVGEYGSRLVKVCVDEDIKALRYIGELIDTKKYDSIIYRCLNQMEEYGYRLVKTCIEQDIEAEKALSQY